MTGKRKYSEEDLTEEVTHEEPEWEPSEEDEAAIEEEEMAPEGVYTEVKAKKPRAKAKRKETAKLDMFGLREGSVRSKAAAIYGSEGGATLNEVKEKLGSDNVHFNVLTQLEKKGFVVEKRKEAGDNNRSVTRYFLREK